MALSAFGSLQLILDRPHQADVFAFAVAAATVVLVLLGASLWLRRLSIPIVCSCTAYALGKLALAGNPVLPYAADAQAVIVEVAMLGLLAWLAFRVGSSLLDVEHLVESVSVEKRAKSIRVVDRSSPYVGI